MSETKVYSVEYVSNGNLCVMQIYGTEEEAEFHADNLGLSQPEEVLANVPEFTSHLN